MDLPLTKKHLLHIIKMLEKQRDGDSQAKYICDKLWVYYYNYMPKDID